MNAYTQWERGILYYLHTSSNLLLFAVIAIIIIRPHP